MNKRSRRHRADLVDLTGKRFGPWAVLRLGSSEGGHTRWRVRCQKCGREVLRRADTLHARSYKRSSCGTACAADMIGRRFGSLVVVAKHGYDKFHKSRWICRCDCGKRVVVGRALLRLGSKVACKRGCQMESMTGKRFGVFLVLGRARRPSGSVRARYWRCRCPCGRITVRHSYGLTRKNGRCLCRMSKQDRAFNAIIGSYKWRSKNKLSVPFKLDRATCRRLLFSPCHYCGLRPSQAFRYGGAKDRYPVWYTGIDRKDSARGYEDGNVVSCCKMCNRLKSCMTYKMFLRWVRAIWSYRVAPKKSRTPPRPRIRGAGTSSFNWTRMTHTRFSKASSEKAYRKRPPIKGQRLSEM